MRIVAAVLLVLVLALQYRLWVSDDGMREMWRLRDEVATQQAENEKLKERNRTLVAEVQDLKQGKTAIEERARTDLGMVGKDESFYQVMSQSTAKEKATVAKKAE
jgi:cell division protein FtsB